MAHDIYVEKIYVQRDQRTGSGVNYEGLLELRGEFAANNVVGPVWPSPTAFISAGQGATVMLNTLVTTVSTLGNVPVKARLWELEPGGGQGGTDFGQNAGVLSLAGNPPVKKLDIPVTLSADTWRERSGTVIVTFRAEKK